MGVTTKGKVPYIVLPLKLIVSFSYWDDYPTVICCVNIATFSIVTHHNTLLSMPCLKSITIHLLF